MYFLWSWTKQHWGFCMRDYTLGLHWGLSIFAWGTTHLPSCSSRPLLEKNSCHIKKECINKSEAWHLLQIVFLSNGSPCFLVTPTQIEHSLLYFTIEHLHKSWHCWKRFSLACVPRHTYANHNKRSTACLDGIRCHCCFSIRQQVRSVNSQVPGHWQCISVQALTLLTGITSLAISAPCNPSTVLQSKLYLGCMEFSLTACRSQSLTNTNRLLAEFVARGSCSGACVVAWTGGRER